MSNFSRMGVRHIPNPRGAKPTNDGSKHPEIREAVGSHVHGFFHQEVLFNLGQPDPLLKQNRML
jgi:hypothetical protein